MPLKRRADVALLVRNEALFCVLVDLDPRGALAAVVLSLFVSSGGKPLVNRQKFMVQGHGDRSKGVFFGHI